MRGMKKRGSQKKCLICGNLFYAYFRHPKHVYCSAKCYGISRKVDRKRTCPTCGISFNRVNKKQKYCSLACRPLRAYKKCKMCGQVFYSGQTRKKTCSPKCLSARRTQIIREHPISRGFPGDKNPNWNGGISFLPEYKRLAHKRKKAIRKLGGILRVSTVRRVWSENIKRFGVLTCIYCLKPIAVGKDQLEHKMPLCRGGTNEYENLAVACDKCNDSKQRKTVEEWINWKHKTRALAGEDGIKAGRVAITLEEI